MSKALSNSNRQIYEMASETGLTPKPGNGHKRTVNWEELDWDQLATLREKFLKAERGQTDYWESREQLAAYDLTFGQRIRWKWDAVLRELMLRNWSPNGSRILDWGCGTAVGSRAVRHHFESSRDLEVCLWDQSPMAMSAAEEILRDDGVERVSIVLPGGLEDAARDAIIVVSHVLNELSLPERESLMRLLPLASSVIWVESGQHAVSRSLIEMRERLLDEGMQAVAPCTHQSACGMLAPENTAHWCHHFARPPVEAFTETHWARFGQMMGIDLRSLPYSFLVMERAKTMPATTRGMGEHPESRMIGRPREFKGFMTLLNCDACGVRELRLQKREAKALHKRLHKGKSFPLYTWKRRGDDIVGGEAFDEDASL